MPNTGHWLPGKRETQLVMAHNWGVILGTRAVVWNIPSNEVIELATLAGTAATALEVAQGSERTLVATALCKAAFDALIEKMRFLKSHYFLSPPLFDTDLVSLDLKSKDTNLSPISPLTFQAEASISLLGVHLMELHMGPVSSSSPDPHSSDYGYRIYYGIMPPNGASVEMATGAKRELMHIPVSGNDLPFSKFTRRKKELFDFAPEDSGKTVYFCIRYENTKGEPSPWGPLFSAVIP
jgi:hypothetical protein